MLGMLKHKWIQKLVDINGAGDVLEDCLKALKILPKVNYAMSGYELEMLVTSYLFSWSFVGYLPICFAPTSLPLDGYLCCYIDYAGMY